MSEFLFTEKPDKVNEICLLSKKLCAPYSVNLRYLMSHLCRVATHSDSLKLWTQRSPQRLAEVFMHMLLRPPWEEIMWVEVIFSEYIYIFYSPCSKVIISFHGVEVQRTCKHCVSVVKSWSFRLYECLFQLIWLVNLYYATKFGTHGFICIFFNASVDGADL